MNSIIIEYFQAMQSPHLVYAPSFRKGCHFNLVPQRHNHSKGPYLNFFNQNLLNAV